jgi:hypothetical protein
MIELTASVMVPWQDMMREGIRAKNSDYKVRYLQDLARQIAQRLMETPGAVQVTEVDRPDMAAKSLTARVLIATEDEARGRKQFTAEAMQKAQYDSMMIDAMRAMRGNVDRAILDAEYPEPAASKYNPGAIFDPVKFVAPDPMAFLRTRAEIANARQDALEAAKAKVRADREIKNKAKARKPQIEVKVRRIQMPEEAKG